jgi:hypothetical protein
MSSTDSKVTALLATAEIFNDMEIDYWLCNGTLLGLYRDGELIPWDEDIDFGLSHLEDRHAIRLAFESKGFALQDDGSGSDYLTFLFMGTRIDLNFFAPRANEMITLWKVPRNSWLHRYTFAACHRLHIPVHRIGVLWTLEGYALPTSALFPVNNAMFYGAALLVPRLPEIILEYTYGSKWRTPIRNYDWRRDGQNNAYG